MVENNFEEKTFYVLIQDSDSLSVVAGHTKFIDTVDDNMLMTLHLDRVNGGYSSLLGLMDINTTDGYISERIALYQRDGTKKMFSFNDFLEMRQDSLSSLSGYTNAPLEKGKTTFFDLTAL